MTTQMTTQTNPETTIKYTRGMQRFHNGQWQPNRIFWRRVNGKDQFLTAYLFQELLMIESEQRKLECRKERFKQSVKEFRKLAKEK